MGSRRTDSAIPQPYHFLCARLKVHGSETYLTDNRRRHHYAMRKASWQELDEVSDILGDSIHDSGEIPYQYALSVFRSNAIWRRRRKFLRESSMFQAAAKGRKER
uniref:Uncharacterized protein n=1 Tax=Manihot esculenta TaxID=3983 RepID=A0A2C9U2Q0_MANES